MAAAIAYFGFLSLFPILLVGLSVVGFLLAGEPALQAEAAKAVTNAVPGLGPAMGENIVSLVNSRAATGIVGLLFLLFAGLRVVDSATVATSRIFRVEDDANFVKQKLRSIAALLGLGLLSLLGAATAPIVGVGLRFSGVVAFLVGLTGTALSLVLDTALFLVAYRVLTAKLGPPWRELWPGALLAGVGWTALKIFGSTYVATQVSNARGVYGSLASVIAVMIYFYLAGRLYVYGAELNAERYDIEGSAASGSPPLPDRRGDASPFDERVAGHRQRLTESTDRPSAAPGATSQAVAVPTDSTYANPRPMARSEGERRGCSAHDRSAPPVAHARGWAGLRPALALLVAIGASIAASRLTPSHSRR